jgi:hypothetical protein
MRGVFYSSLVGTFIALMGINLFFLRKKVLALILIVISSQVKIPTIGLLLPIIVNFIPLKEKLDNNKIILLFIFSTLLATGYALTKVEIQPWYFLWIFPFIALLKPNKYIIGASIGFSFGLLLRYTVLLYFGNWDGIGVPLRNSFTIIAPIIFVFIIFLKDRLFSSSDTKI